MVHTLIASFIVHKDGKVLVEKRKMTKKVDPGTVVLPSGHVEEGETFEQTCERELMEETSLECKEFNFVIKLPHVANTGEKMMIYFYGCGDWTGEPQSHEAEKVFWISLEEIDVLNCEIDRIAVRKFFEMLKKN